MRLKNRAKEPIGLLSKLFLTFFIIYLLMCAWVRLPIFQITRSYSLPSWTRKPIAHRGIFDNSFVPENSLKAFELALKRGFAFELDVMLSKDQEVVVFHDEQLLRMTGVSGEFVQWNAKDLGELKLLKTDQTPPALSKVLQLINGQVPIHLEIKQEGVVGPLESKVLDLLKTYAGPICILSFNPNTLEWFKVNGPEYIRVLNVEGPFGFDQRLLGLIYDVLQSRPHMINVDIQSLSPLSVKLLRPLIPLGAYTINNSVTFNQYKRSLHHVIFEDFKGEWIDKSPKKV